MSTGTVVKLKRYEAGENAPSLVSVCASEIAPESVEWIWPGRLAKGKHTCIAGEPGTGKSQLTMWIAAAVSTGGSWPCGEGNAGIGSIIILSAEDGAADTIVPRLHAAEADLGRVQIVQSVREGVGRRSFNLQSDLALLEQEVKRIGDVTLIIIDPVSSYLGKTDSHKNAEVRSVLEPIGEFADRMRVAILTVTHFSKAGAGTSTKALHRFIGSIAFVGAPRIALAVIEDADNERRLLLHAKNNLAPAPAGLAYKIKEKIVGEPGKAITAPCVIWEPDTVSLTANEAMAADASAEGSRSALMDAEEFLLDLLSDGGVAANAVKAEAQSAGLGWATVRRAKDRLGIKPKREGFQERASWIWELPKVLKNPEDAQAKNMSTFGDDEHLRRNNHTKSDDCPDLPEFLDRRARGDTASTSWNSDG